jgi:hypothetical protein
MHKWLDFAFDAEMTGQDSRLPEQEKQGNCSTRKKTGHYIQYRQLGRHTSKLQRQDKGNGSGTGSVAHFRHEEVQSRFGLVHLVRQYHPPQYWYPSSQRRHSVPGTRRALESISKRQSSRSTNHVRPVFTRPSTVFRRRHATFCRPLIHTLATSRHKL